MPKDTSLMTKPKTTASKTLQNQASRHKLWAYGLLSAAALFWAGNFVMGRGVAEDVPPMALSFWRWLLAALIILPFAWPHLQKDAATIRGHLPYFLLMGFLGGANFNALTYLALHTTTANNAFILNASNALFILLATAIIHRLKPSKGEVIAIVMAIVGMVLIITKGNPADLLNFSIKSGDLLVILSIISWAIYTALLKNRPSTHPLTFANLTFASAALVLLPVMLIEHLFFTPLSLTQTSGAAIMFAALFPGLLAYVFYNRGVELIGANAAGITIYMVPVFGILLSAVFLNETIETYHLSGFALIISGVIISALKPSDKK